MPRLPLVIALLALACGKKEEPAKEQAAPPPVQKQASQATGGEMRGERDDKPPPANPSGVTVALIVDGAARPPLSAGDLGRVKGMQVEGDSGEESRDAWSAREVMATLVGPGARLVRVKGDEGKKDVAVDEAQWKDASRIPVLRINRRGLVKFYWAAANGNPLVADEVRGVTEMQVATH